MHCLSMSLLKQNYLFSIIKRNSISDDMIRVFVHNVRLLPKHIDDADSDNRIINNEIMRFTKTNQSIRFYLQNNGNIEFQLMDVVMMLLFSDKFDANGISIFSFKKHAFVNRVPILMSVYQKTIHADPRMLQYLVATYSPDIFAGEFSYDLLKVSQNKLLDIFTDGK